MKHIALIVNLIFCSTLASLAQKADDVLFTVNSDKVKVEEFRYIYEKNNAEDDSLYSEENLKDYLDLYIKFKLKVQAARDAGIDTSDSFKEEFEKYRAQLAKPYLNDREVTEQLIEEAYNRMQEELRVSHILINSKPSDPPADTLAAYKKINALKDSLEAGADFTDLAKRHSDDPSVRHNDGDLGYFSTFMMIYPFESAAYQLEQGEVSEPVKTQFGYHLLKLEDRRPNRGEVRVDQIAIKTGQTASKEDQQIAKAKLDTIYNKLENGANFDKLMEEYNATAGFLTGPVPMFESLSRRIPEEFRNKAFQLDKPGEYTKPFQSSYGWHIIQLEEKQKMGELDKQLKQEIKKKVSRDSRSQKSKESAIRNFKEENNFKRKDKRLEELRKSVDSSLLTNTWEIPEDELKLDKWIIKIGGNKVSLREAAEYIKENQRKIKEKSVEVKFESLYDRFEDKVVLDHEESQLDEKYPEYRNLVKEYREGILLFEITEDRVWQRASVDTSGLKEFYKNNRGDYIKSLRFDALIVKCKSMDVLNKVVEIMKDDSLTNNNKLREIKSLNKEDATNINAEEGVFEIGDYPFLSAEMQEGIHTEKTENAHYAISIREKIPAGPPELSEIRGIVVSDYQDKLEKSWVKELREKYEVELNEKVLNKLAK